MISKPTTDKSVGCTCAVARKAGENFALLVGISPLFALQRREKSPKEE